VRTRPIMRGKAGMAFSAKFGQKPEGSGTLFHSFIIGGGPITGMPAGGSWYGLRRIVVWDGKAIRDWKWQGEILTIVKDTPVLLGSVSFCGN